MDKENTKKIITRFPPSPTGYLHVGSARTALFNYIFAKQNGGEMLFRSEDTDKERSKQEFEDEILESLEWLGIKFDKTKIIRQSERGEIYKRYLEKMIAEGTAYISKEAVEKEGDRAEVIRFKNPNKEVIFTDTVRGEIKFDTTELGDFVIAKSLSEPLYHLAVVVDDYEKMIADGTAYISKEIVEKEGDRAEVIRFKNQNKGVIFTDTVRGEIKFDTTELGDFVIAKSLSEPLYHLAVVVDDYEMGVTHVIRGEDGISNTPRQILIQEAVGAPRPVYTHMPFSLAPDRSKLSKRHGAVSIREYRKMGYLPEAMVNYLMLLGWNPGTDQEIFTFDELVAQFDINKIQKGGAIFDIIKLNWVNTEHIKRMSENDFKTKVFEFLPEEIKKERGYSDFIVEKILPIIKERISKFSEITEMYQAGEFGYYFNVPEYDKEKLVWKDADVNTTKAHLNRILEILDEIDNFKSDLIKESLWNYATEQGRGAVLWPMRFALSGKDKSPDPFTLAEVLGKPETVDRIKIALKKLN